MMKKKLTALVAGQLRKFPGFVDLLNRTAHAVSPETVALLDFPIFSRRRWTEANPHGNLYRIIDSNRDSYKSDLQFFRSLSGCFTAIAERETASQQWNDPCWINGWMPALDGVALYGYLVKYRPKIYLEVGSGNSTKFARRAIVDHKLDTKIVSIDPCPRAEINEICDEVIRRPVEEVDLKIFDRLGANDILYIDNSHRVLMNSDATAVFIDVIPRLVPGVVVEIHDVTLPFDYPAEWNNRFYSEQYLLAAYLLAKGNLFDIVLPNMFISHDDELKEVLAPLWRKEELKNVETHGCSFWIRMK